MLAAMNGHTAAVKLLLDMGSDINAQVRYDLQCKRINFIQNNCWINYMRDESARVMSNLRFPMEQMVIIISLALECRLRPIVVQRIDIGLFLRSS